MTTVAIFPPSEQNGVSALTNGFVNPGAATTASALSASMLNQVNAFGPLSKKIDTGVQQFLPQPIRDSMFGSDDPDQNNAQNEVMSPAALPLLIRKSPQNYAYVRHSFLFTSQAASATIGDVHTAFPLPIVNNMQFDRAKLDASVVATTAAKRHRTKHATVLLGLTANSANQFVKLWAPSGSIVDASNANATSTNLLFNVAAPNIGRETTKNIFGTNVQHGTKLYYAVRAGAPDTICRIGQQQTIMPKTCVQIRCFTNHCMPYHSTSETLKPNELTDADYTQLDARITATWQETYYDAETDEVKVVPAETTADKLESVPDLEYEAYQMGGFVQLGICTDRPAMCAGEDTLRMAHVNLTTYNGLPNVTMIPLRIYNY